MSDLAEGVKAGVGGATTGAAVAGAAAGIGAAVGASLGPFAAIAAPVGAAIGAMIGFFIWLGGQSKKDKAERIERLTKAKAAHDEALAAAAETGPGLVKAMDRFTTEINFLLGAEKIYAKAAKEGKPVPANWQMGVEFGVKNFIADDDACKTLRIIAQNHPQYAPMVDELFNGLRLAAKDRKNMGTTLANLRKVVDFVAAIGALPGNLEDDPFAYLRPPLSDTFGAGLAAAGINVGDPKTLAIMRGNYDVGAVEVAMPRKNLAVLPIARKSIGGGNVAVDQRALSMKLAPYGVISFALAPSTALSQWQLAEPYASSHGLPMSAPWPYGLDSDRFAKPPKPVGVSPVVKGGAVLAAAGIAALVLL